PSERSVKPETAAGEGTRSPGDRHALVYRLPFGVSPVARASALFPTIGPSYCGGWRVGSTPGVPRRVKTLLADSVAKVQNFPVINSSPKDKPTDDRQSM